MSDPSEWEKGNGDYIHTALNWLRLSLIRLSQQKESCIENYQEGRIDDGAAIQETAAEERATYDSIPDESAREKSEISPKDHTEGSTVVETTPQSGDVTGPKAEFQSTEQTTEKKKQDGSWGWFKSVLTGNQGDNGKENSQSSPSGVEIKKDESHVAQAPQEPSPKVERQVTSSEVDEAALKMDKVAQDMKQPPALILLGQRLGLSTFEREVLLLCSAMDLEENMASLCSRAQGDPSKRYPTFSLALNLFKDSAWDALSPHGPLRYLQLVEFSQTGVEPLNSSPMRCDQRIVDLIKGLNYLDDRLLPFLVPMSFAAVNESLAPSQQAAVEKILVYYGQQRLDRANVVQLLGRDASSKQLIAGRASFAMNLMLYRLPGEQIPTQPSDMDTLSRLWQRESMLLPLALFIDLENLDRSSPGALAAVNRFVLRLNCAVFLDTSEPDGSMDGLLLEVSRPTPVEQRDAWQAALGDQAGELPDLLAGQFDMNVQEINRIAAMALASSGGSIRDRLWQLCRDETRPILGGMAQRILPKSGWDDLVLQPSDIQLLHQIAEQVRYRSRVYDRWGFRNKTSRGLGISVLFAGESGTGKTMAAEVIAKDLGLDLYKIDLSQVVNKYIGETEKNLKRVFDEAERTGALVLFDEADALFGKRSEVKDSHDRYANIEINYLLQRIESYRGLAILATNIKSAIDPAFLRRLRFVLTFRFPDQSERKIIWQKVFPHETPKEDLDFERLSKLNLTGGSIYNIAMNSAFLAASAGTKVNMDHILTAAKIELRKMERPISEADFHTRSSGGRAGGER
jgi:hypothetical protein